MSQFTAEELGRYSRQLLLEEIGFEGQQLLKQAKVLVVGAGGLGCPVLQYLSAAGLGTLGIVDFDRVERHNLHRQILYTVADIGRAKAPVAAARLRAANPHVQYQVFEEKLDASNAAQLIASFDIVVDGSDNFACRYLVNDTCVQLQKTLVYGSILGFEGQLAVFRPQWAKDLRDIYPEAPDPATVPNCGVNGVVGVVPGTLGLYMANAVIQLVLGQPMEQALFVFDFKNFQCKRFAF